VLLFRSLPLAACCVWKAPGGNRGIS